MSLRIDLFSTLDGVGQAPGGPEEDSTGGFAWGGWQAPYEDDVAGARIMAGMATMDALLLGRRTYDLFREYWPAHGDTVVGEVLNRVPKYVASRGTPELTWAHSTRLGPDLAAEVTAVRERHADVHVIGSIDLVQTLFALGLWDELNLWVYPVVLGSGRRIFPDGGTPAALRHLEPPVTGSAGAISLRLGPDGAPRVGEVSPE